MNQQIPRTSIAGENLFLRGSKQNHFNLIRIIAATAVLFCHSFVLTGHVEPGLFGSSWGGIAVYVFFVISGYLVTGSLMRHGTKEYFIARACRIYPGLWVALIVTVAMCPDIFQNPLSAAKYLIFNSLLVFGIRYGETHLFPNNPYPATLNGSLWTLPYEVWCYIGIAAIGGVGLLRKKNLPFVFAAFALICIILLVFLPNLLAALPQRPLSPERALRLGFLFFCGAAVFIFRESLKTNALITFSCFVITFLIFSAVQHLKLNNDIAFIIGAPFFSFGVLSLAYLNFPALTSYNRLGDYSYGMYIYAFPIQQTLVALTGTTNPHFLTLIAFPVTLLFAVLSWIYVEKPSKNMFRSPAPSSRTSISRVPTD